jgi:hypothetical protein
MVCDVEHSEISPAPLRKEENSLLVLLSKRDLTRCATNLNPHPPAPSPKAGEGEQELVKVPLPEREKDLG